MAKKIFSRRTLALVLALVMCFSMFQMVAYAAPGDSGRYSYAYYLGQEYLGNAAGAAVKPDPVGYGFQGVITSITFTDDVGTSWTFNWSSEANGEWRITGNGVSKSKASAWPQVTDGKTYVGYCGSSAYTFTLSNDGSSEAWTYVNDSHANWFRYIRFIREYTVNVFYQNETGNVSYNGETFAAADPVIGSFYFLYPDGGIIDDSEYEDGEYTEPTTLLPANYLPQSMKDQGYEIKYATDAQGNDVLSSGVTISLLGSNVLNVYCTLIPPATVDYAVKHEYYMDGTYEGTQNGSNITVPQGSDFDSIVAGITKLTSYNGNTYSYISYDVDPAQKVITLTYTRARPTYDYAVTYNANFGQNPATAADIENVTGVYDESYSITADACTFTRENYYFAGWNTEANGSGTPYAADEAIALTAQDNTAILYAQWQENPKYDYIVTYNADFGATPATASDAENVTQVYDTSKTIGIDENMFTRENYTFVGWATESGGPVRYQPGVGLSFIKGGEEELFAVWVENPKYAYSLIYDGNGGLVGGLAQYADEENESSTYATSYSIGVNTNTFVRENYTFIGWNTEANGSGISYAAGDTVALTAQNNSEVLYAQWQENPKYDYSVTYDANYGQNPETKADAENVRNVYDEAYRIITDENTFVRENYTFIGWDTEPDGSGKTYLAGQAVNLTKDANEEILYAQWQENPKYDYSVTYNANFGEDPETKADAENVEQVYDTTYDIGIDTNSFVRENYTFIGWATEADGQVAYQAGETLSFVEGGSEELFAVWVENDKYSYTVIYNGNGGALVDGEKAYGDAENVTDVYEEAYEIAVDANSFVRENYVFTGWNSQADGKGIAYTAEQVLELTAEDNIRTLYAQWKELPKYDYIVTYNANYGENPATAADRENAIGTYETEKVITVDTNPFKRDNYKFIGWATEPDGKVVYAPVAKLSFTKGGSEELFAVWEIIEREYTVEYLVKVDDDPYEPYPGETPEGGKLPHGTPVGKDLIDPPAQLDDGTYIYEYVTIEEIVLGEGENVVRVYYQYITPPAPAAEPVVINDEPVPLADEPVAPAYDPEPASEDEPVAPAYDPEPVATVDDDGLVELPDEEVPLADAPKTGDPMLLYAGMTALSGAGLVWMGLGKKKEEKEEEE